MIEKLRKRIFYLVFISISIIVLGVIILFAILNYHNTINTAVMMINRMTQIGLIREEPDKPPRQENIENQREIEGVYHVIVRDGSIDNITDNDDIDEKIEEYALEISKKNVRDDSGIKGNYIYNVRKRGENAFEITFMENEDAITHANSILIVSVILCGISLIAIYI